MLSETSFPASVTPGVHLAFPQMLSIRQTRSSLSKACTVTCRSEHRTGTARGDRYRCTYFEPVHLELSIRALQVKGVRVSCPGVQLEASNEGEELLLDRGLLVAAKLTKPQEIHTLDKKGCWSSLQREELLPAL